MLICLASYDDGTLIKAQKGLKSNGFQGMEALDHLLLPCIGFHQPSASQCSFQISSPSDHLVRHALFRGSVYEQFAVSFSDSEVLQAEIFFPCRWLSIVMSVWVFSRSVIQEAVGLPLSCVKLWWTNGADSSQQCHKELGLDWIGLNLASDL